jgi:hypothetical protein
MKIFTLDQSIAFSFNSLRPSLIAVGSPDIGDSGFLKTSGALTIYNTKGVFINSLDVDHGFNKIVWSQAKDYGKYNQGLIAATHIGGGLSIYDPELMFGNYFIVLRVF